MRLYIYLILSLLTLGCRNSVADRKTGLNVTNRSNIDSLPVKKSTVSNKVLIANEEYLSWDSIKINGEASYAFYKTGTFQPYR